jgi:thermopsin
LANQSFERTLFTRAKIRGKSIPVVIVVSLLVLASFTSLLLVSVHFAPSSAVAETTSPKSHSSSLKAHQSVPLTQSLTLRRGYYQYYEADSFSNNASVAYAVSSTSPISTALMTLTQLDEFANNTNDPVSNSITYGNGTSVQNNVTIAPGQYFLVFYAYYSRTSIQFGYQVSPNTPFSYGPVPSPLASGIASFGISNKSGVVTPYEIRTNEIVAIANISSLQVNTASASQYGVNPTGATLQLNTLLVVNENSTSSSSPNQKVYWLQSVPDFVTGLSQVSFGDEIWNWTDQSGFLSNQTVTSTNFQNGGFVSPSGNGNSGPYVYNYNGNNQTYNLPLNFSLLETETLLPKTGVLVQLGYMMTANGSASSTSRINWFDNITIVDPNVQGAYFDVSGKSPTPIGLYYDAELVFAGEGNLEIAHFTQLGASLGLFYSNSTSHSGMLSSFPTYYSFSGATGESADDLVVTYSNGIASIGTGVNPNYVYLGNSTRSLILGSTTSSTTTSTSQTTTTSTTTATTNNTSSTSSATTTTSTSSTSALPSTTGPSATTTTNTTSSISSEQQPGTGNSTSSLSYSSSVTTSSSTGSAASNSSSSPSSGVTSKSSSPTTSKRTAGMGLQSAWEWIAVGAVVTIILCSLAIMVLRRRPPTGSLGLATEQGAG